MAIRLFSFAILCLALPAMLYSSTVLENTGSLTKGPLTVTVTYITVMNVNPEPLMNDWNEVDLFADHDFIFDSATIYNKNEEELFNYKRDQENPEDFFNRLSFKYDSNTLGDLNYLSVKVNLVQADSLRSKTLDFDLNIIDNRYRLSETEITVLEEDRNFNLEDTKSSNIEVDLEADLELVEIIQE